MENEVVQSAGVDTELCSGAAELHVSCDGTREERVANAAHDYLENLEDTISRGACYCHQPAVLAIDCRV
jgi:hypothetical protein